MLRQFLTTLKALLQVQQPYICDVANQHTAKELKALQADIQHNIHNNYIKIPKILWSNFLDFQYHHNHSQTVFLVVLAWLVHMCYGITDALIMPDMLLQMLAIRFISALICIPALVYVLLRRNNVFVWDIVGMTILTAIGLCWFWLLYHTQSQTAPSYIYATLIFIVIAAAFVQSSTRIAAIHMLIMTAGAVFVVETKFAEQHANAIIGFIMAFLPMVVFCFYSCWRNIQAAKRRFLEKVLDELKVSSLASSNQSLQSAATTDPLTKLANRRLFERQCNYFWQRHRTTGENFAVFIIDIDYFKTYNDTYGHPAGDVCLKRIADFLQGMMVDGLSSVYRLGGEEFAVVIDCKRLSDLSIINLAKQMVERVRELKITHESRPDALGFVTYSVGGCVSSKYEHKTLADVLRSADQMLYQAKRHGRNQSCIYKPTKLSAANTGQMYIVGAGAKHDTQVKQSEHGGQNKLGVGQKSHF